MQNIPKLYPTGKIVIILDNSQIHHARLLKPFLSEHAHRLNLAFLLPHSPKLSLIEGLWGWLKSEIINNVFYNTAKEIRNAVRDFNDSVVKIPQMVIYGLCVRL